MIEAVLCSNCFRDQGLRLDSFKVGIQDDSACANCGSRDGRKLSRDLIARLAHRFFVRGTIHRTQLRAAPIVQFNEHQTTSISAAAWFEPDLRLIQKAIGVGFFYYGPRLWMVGEVEPLNRLFHCRGLDSEGLDEIPGALLNRPVESAGGGRRTGEAGGWALDESGGTQPQ